MIRMLRCVHAVVWFGMTVGIYDNLDICSEDKSGHIPATVCYQIPDEPEWALVCHVPKGHINANVGDSNANDN